MAEDQPYQLGTFSAHVGDKFTIQAAGAVLCAVELVEANSRGGSEERGEAAAKARNFSLLFHDPDATVASHLPQAIYEFRHDSLGTLNLFIVPIGPGSGGTGIAYEAVFTSA